MSSCTACGSRTHSEIRDVYYKGILIGKFEAEVCSSCSEVFYSNEAWKAIVRLEKVWEEIGIPTAEGIASGGQVSLYPSNMATETTTAVSVPGSFVKAVFPGKESNVTEKARPSDLILVES